MTHPLTLCFVADSASIHVQRWMAYFAQRGHRIYCLSDHPQAGVDGVCVLPLPSWQDTPKRKKTSYQEKQRKMKSKGKILEVQNTPIKSVVIEARAHAIRQYVETLKPDVVHAHFLYYRGWASALADVSPLVISLWGSDVHLPRADRQQPQSWGLSQLLNILSLMRAHHITAVSPDLCRAARWLTLGTRPVDLIPIGTDPALFNRNVPPDKLAALRASLHLPDDAFVILSPRQMTPLYNIETIIAAIPPVLQQAPHAVFLLKDAFCNTAERQAYVTGLKQQAEALGVSHAIRWVNEVPFEELPHYYALADVVVSIPSTDGMPVTLFEALACGTPVVAGNLASYRGVFTHKQSALLIPPTHPQALAEALLTLMRTPTLAARLIDNGAAVVQRYGIFDDQMVRMEALYQQLAQANRESLSQSGLRPLWHQAMQALLRLNPDPIFDFDPQGLQLPSVPTPVLNKHPAR